MAYGGTTIPRHSVLMKHKFLILLLVTITATFSATAYDFMVDGIAYDFNDDGTSVTVVREADYWDGNNYANLSGTLQIPAKVAYNGTEYDVTRIGDGAFKGCTGITELILPNSILVICYGAFTNCTGIAGELVVPNSVRFIGQEAFYGCSGITKLYLGENLRVIDNSGSFGNLKELKEVHIKIAIPPFKYDNSFSFGERGDGEKYSPDDIDFYSVYDNCILYVPQGSKQLYMCSGDWSLFSRIIEEDESGNPVMQYDVDGSGIVDVEDVNHIVNKILKLE